MLILSRICCVVHAKICLQLRCNLLWLGLGERPSYLAVAVYTAAAHEGSPFHENILMYVQCLGLIEVLPLVSATHVFRPIMGHLHGQLEICLVV